MTSSSSTPDPGSASPSAQAPDPSARRPALKRQISFVQLLAYGMVFIGPAAAVGVFGTLDAKSGGVVPLVYLVATAVMALTASSYAVMSRAVPRAGSVFAYTGTALGPRTGFLSGWMVLLDYLLIPSVGYLFSGIALNSLFPQIPVWVFVVAAVLLTTGLNTLGVKVTAWVSTGVVVFEVVALLIVLVAGVAVLARTGPLRSWADPFTGGAGGIEPHLLLGGVSVAILSYLGFDSLATFAEETRGGARTIGRATLVCLVVVGLLFMAQTYIGALLSPLTTSQLQADPSLQGDAYYTMVDESISPALHWLLAFAKAAGGAFAALVGQSAASRVLMDMGRQRALPAAFARITPRTGVPIVGVLVAALGNVLVAGSAATRDDGLDIVTSIVDVGALVGFVMVHVSVIAYFVARRRGGKPSVLRHVVIPVAGAASLLLVLVNSAASALVVGGAWLIVGLVIMVARRRQRRDGPTEA